MGTSTISPGSPVTRSTSGGGEPTRSRPCSGATLVAAMLGFFVVTLDAVIVNVALPDIGADLGGGITGLQWVATATHWPSLRYCSLPGHSPTGSAPSVPLAPGW